MTANTPTPADTAPAGQGAMQCGAPHPADFTLCCGLGATHLGQHHADTGLHADSWPSNHEALLIEAVAVNRESGSTPRSLLREVEGLKAQRRNWLDNDITARTLVTQEKVIEGLLAALKSHGVHPDICGRWIHGPRGSVLGDRECTCGLDAAICRGEEHEPCSLCEGTREVNQMAPNLPPVPCPRCQPVAALSPASGGV